MEEANSVDIYAGVRPELERIMNRLAGEIGELAKNREGDKLYEHLAFRIKSDESAREKLIRKGFEVTAENALRELKDSIGLRVVCLFVDDVYECVRLIKTIPYVSVFKEKDYISEAKPNGYRSYHMILEVKEETEGKTGGPFYAEIQLRTIAMDTWAALEHELKYKKNIANQEMIVQELHRCANDLAACDVSMQTLRQIIKNL